MKTEYNGRFITAVTIVLLIFMVAPLVVVVALSITPSKLAMFPPTGFTLEWYAKVLATEKFRHSFMVSASLAAGATILSLVIGTPAAMAINKNVLPGSRLIETLLLSPMILPILITGLALFQFMAAQGMRSTGWNLLIGHAIITLPYMMRTVTASLKQIDHSLEEAASTLGAPPLTVFFKVTVPQIAPGILAGCLFAFMISFDDFPISLWLADARIEPLPIYLHHQMSTVFDPSIAAMSALMIATGIIVVILLEKLVGLRKAMGV